MRVSVARHVRALERSRRPPRLVYWNAVKSVPARLARLRPDAVLLHNTLLGVRWSSLYERFRAESRWLADLDCVKIATPQDDYDHADRLDEWLAEVGVTDVFTSLFDDRTLLYPNVHERARFHRALTGYVDDATAVRQPRPLESRRLDVVYRASPLPFRYGSMGHLKLRLGEETARAAARVGLAADVSTRPEDVVVGERWLDFLASSRTTVGMESGSSALDRRGEIGRRADELLREEPSRSFEEVSALMPAGWDSHRFFTVGPRHFEAAATGTAQLLVEGTYLGILEANVHYLPIRRDLSDLEQVLESAGDVDLLREVAGRARADLILSGRYSYASFAERLTAVVEEGRRSALRGEVAWRAGAAALALGERAPKVLVRLREEPLAMTAKGLRALRFALASRPLRRLLADWARGPSTVSTHALLADLLRLHLLERRTFPLAARLEGRRLVLRSGEEDGLPPSELAAALAGVDEIIWDHSALGTHVGEVEVGIGARHRLEAIESLARRRPDHVTGALLAVLGCRARKP